MILHPMAFPAFFVWVGTASGVDWLYQFTNNLTNPDDAERRCALVRGHDAAGLCQPHQTRTSCRPVEPFDDDDQLELATSPDR